MQGKVHANFGLHVCIRPVVWKENEDKQTDRQTDTPFCVTIIDKLGGDSTMYPLKIIPPAWPFIRGFSNHPSIHFWKKTKLPCLMRSSAPASACCK